MNPISKLFRLIRIQYILARNGLDNVVVSIHLFSSLRFLVYLNPWNWFRKQRMSRGVALRKTLEDLGPIFIKFGQALSTRPDILPPDIAEELKKLQDKVPPFSSALALELFEKAFGESAYDIFAEFNATPLASASMAQVHAAQLKTGEEVVVKILRPKMRKLIQQDLGLLHTIASLVDKYWAESKRLKPKEIVEEFEANLLDELDLQREAANAAQLRRNFKDSPLLYIPEIYWDYTRENIMVMERIDGIPVSNIGDLKAQGTDIKTLAERGVEIFFTQVFRDCFFHADMHPGNIFVSKQHPENPQYICIDFGIIGTLTDSDKRYLAENLLAFFNRDYKKVAELHVASGWVARDTRVADFESAIRTVCEPIFEKPLKDISFGQVVLRLFQVARRFHMEVQPQLILLQKTLLAIEGLGRQLYPELDLWATAKPFLEKWLKDQLGPKTALKQLQDNLPFFVEHLPHMPRVMYEVLQLQKNQMMVQQEACRSDRPSLEESRQSGRWQGLGLGLLVVGLGGFIATEMQFIVTEALPTVFLTSAVVGGLFIFFHRATRS